MGIAHELVDKMNKEQIRKYRGELILKSAMAGIGAFVYYTNYSIQLEGYVLVTSAAHNIATSIDHRLDSVKDVIVEAGHLLGIYGPFGVSGAYIVEKGMDMYSTFKVKPVKEK